MEKYNEVIKQLREIRGLKTAFDVEYNSFSDSILLNFKNMKVFHRLENENNMTWKSFDFICYMNDIKYDFNYGKDYGKIELYF